MRYHDRLIFWVLGAVLVLLAAVALLAQSATYPAGVVSFTTKTAGQTIQSAHVNTIQAEITAIENALLNGLAHVVKPLTDATYDLGTGAFRWRDGFFSRNVTIGGALTAPALIGGWTVVTSTSTGTLNDFAPGLVGNTVVRMNNATLATITGFAGGADGQLVELDAVGAGEVDLSPQDVLSTTAADRLINVATSGKTPLAPSANASALFRYDGTTSRWRLIAHEQGAPVAYTPTWTGGSPTIGNGTLTGRYFVRGRQVTFQVTWAAGSTTTFGSTSGWAFTVPLAAEAASYVGAVKGVRTSVSHRAATWAIPSAGTTFTIFSEGDTSSGWGATDPVTWAAGDTFTASGVYFTS